MSGGGGPGCLDAPPLVEVPVGVTPRACGDREVTPGTPMCWLPESQSATFTFQPGTHTRTSLTSQRPEPPPCPHSTWVTHPCVCHSSRFQPHSSVPPPDGPRTAPLSGHEMRAKSRCPPGGGVSPGAAVCLPHLLGVCVGGRGDLTWDAEQSLTRLHPIRAGLMLWAGKSLLRPCLLSTFPPPKPCMPTWNLRA